VLTKVTVNALPGDGVTETPKLVGSCFNANFVFKANH